jgi:quercetin dioxygenase-like cupin family protein
VEDADMSKRAQPRRERPTSPLPLLQISFAEQLERLKQEPAWHSGDRNAITLTKEPQLRVLLLAMKRGSNLHEHRASGPVTIQVVSGLVRLTVSAQVLDLKPGELAILESAIAHEVEAVEESALLLTLVKPG